MTVVLAGVLTIVGGGVASASGFAVGNAEAARAFVAAYDAKAGSSGSSAAKRPQPWVSPTPSATPAPVATLPPGAPQSLTVAQLTSELILPSDFSADDWKTVSTTTLSPSYDGSNECFYDFTNIDGLAGVTTGVERDLEEASTTHYISQTVEYTPKSAQVLADETTSLKQCGYSSSYLDEHDNTVIQTSADLDANTIGIKVNVPSLCRSFSDHSDVEADDDYSGFFCTVLSGGHVIRLTETSTDNAYPVTTANFADNVNGALGLANP